LQIVGNRNLNTTRLFGKAFTATFFYIRHCYSGDYSHTDKGIKDCSKCLIPRRNGGFYYVADRLKKHFVTDIDI